MPKVPAPCKHFLRGKNTTKKVLARDRKMPHNSLRRSNSAATPAKGSSMYEPRLRNTQAFARLAPSAKFKGMFKLVVAFNLTERDSRGRLRFPRQADCAYVSGDIALADLPVAMREAAKAAWTENIVIVD